MSPPLTCRIRAITVRSTDNPAAVACCSIQRAGSFPPSRPVHTTMVAAFTSALVTFRFFASGMSAGLLPPSGLENTKASAVVGDGVGEVVDQRLQRPHRLVLVGDRFGPLALLLGVEQLFGLQDDHDAARGDHRQRPRGLGDHDGRHRGIDGVQAFDIEGPQVLLDHLAQRDGKRGLLMVVVTDDQVDRIGRAGGKLRAKLLRSQRMHTKRL